MDKKIQSRVSAHRRRVLLDDIFLQPWFIDFETGCAIRRLLPEACFRKLRFYFDDWGCMICRKKKVAYGCNGMCSTCTQRIQKRLFSCLQKRGLQQIGLSPCQQSEYDRVRGAKTLLSDLVKDHWTPKRMKLRKIEWD